MAFLITTTGAGSVDLSDLGYREPITHPTVGLDLLSLGFTIEQINNSQKLREALGNNPTPKITATYNGIPVDDTFDIIRDKLNKDANLSDIDDPAVARANLGLGALATMNYVNVLDGGSP